MAIYISFLIEKDGASFWFEDSEFYSLHFLLFNFIWFFSATSVGLYDNIIRKEAIPILNSTIFSLVIYFLAPILFDLVIPGFNLSTRFLLHSFAIYAGLVFAFRVFALLLRKSRRQFWIDYNDILIVGAGREGQRLNEYLSSNPFLGYKVKGFFDDNVKDNSVNGMLLGKMDECFSYAKLNGISEVFCALPANDIQKSKRLMKEADRNLIRFRLIPDLDVFSNKSIVFELHDKLPVLSPRAEPLENKANGLVKRVFDLCFSILVILFILSWVVPLLALIIKLESKGPVFFKQLRSGKDNKPFWCYKFRTMVVNADSDSLQATRDDSRVTRAGKLLRRASIDELPQFFNVLKGEMSVVGPRPHMLKHTEDYSQLIDSFMVRHFLAPGITGWAQVMGYRGETREIKAMAKRVEADIWYLENWSFMLDLKIIFLTVWQLFTGSDKAY